MVFVSLGRQMEKATPDDPLHRCNIRLYGRTHGLPIVGGKLCNNIICQHGCTTKNAPLRGFPTIGGDRLEIFFLQSSQSGAELSADVVDALFFADRCFAKPLTITKGAHRLAGSRVSIAHEDRVLEPI